MFVNYNDQLEKIYFYFVDFLDSTIIIHTKLSMFLISYNLHIFQKKIILYR